MIDAVTKLWVRGEGDERAVRNGCRVDLLRGAWAVWWIERYCRLYEGEGYAGKPLVIHGCHDCDHSEFYAVQEWDETGKAIHLERAALYAECVAAGHQIDWQYEFFMRLFSWVRHSDKWKREVRRFRQSVTYVPKKSKKSPSLAALGLYLLAGDGEPGNNVYLCAKDGEQSREIAAKHTFEMLRQSEELKSECTPNKTLMQILHEPSRSRLKPLSSANARTQESKEGLNGSILIDEEHVVDRPFVNRLDRAGISRAEPLFSSFSTAGNNPDSYGKERSDYARDVMLGNRVDEELLAMIYEAPQDLTAEQLDADFEKYARMANPALGHTIELRELRGDYERSKETIENLARCLMYRFNVWQHSSNPWLKKSDWMKCKADYTEADLLGKPCFAGLDLGFTDDMTALVLVFPWGEERYRLWPYLFTSEVAAKKASDKAPWKTWEKEGHVHFFTGDTTDFPYLRKFIGETLRNKFELQTIAYDKHLAATLAQDLQDDYGLEMVPFLQTPGDFAEPMNIFENDIIGQRIEHPNNLCLNWHAGNATKNQRNGLLEKPTDRSKKIDGIVAAIMGRAMANQEVANYWNPSLGVYL